MGQSVSGNSFYKVMGVILLAIVISGFGSLALLRGLSPLELPLLFHLHAIIYLTWFGLFIYQASLIGSNNRALHMTLGKLSVAIVIIMLITAAVMAKGTYGRGISPIPNISIEQFMAFPVFDLAGLVVFYTLALANRSNAEFHKRAMLLTSIAILDPASSRIGFALSFPPTPLVVSLLLLGAIIWHDRKVLSRVHFITWFGLAWVFLRLGFVFGFGSTDLWSDMANNLFG